MTEIALVEISVPGCRCYCVRGGGGGGGVCEQFLGDQVAWVTAADLAQDCLVGQIASFGARPGFEVVRDAGCGGEAAFAEWARYVGAAVD